MRDRPDRTRLTNRRRRDLLAPSTLLALLASAGAQEPAAARPVRFTLPAGRHDLRALVDLTAQITKIPIACDDDVLALADDRSVTLQRELQLGADDWFDVATTLLFHRGLLLAPDDRPGRLRVGALRSAREFFAKAPECAPEAVLAGSMRAGVAATVVPDPGNAGMLRRNLLAPLFLMRDEPWALQVGTVEGGTRLVGTRDQVAVAIRLLALQDGRDPPPRPATVWREGALGWPGGTMPLAPFLSLLQERLDANVLATELPPEIGLDLGEPAETTAAAWFARATRALREAKLLLLPVAATQRVFELRSAAGPRPGDVAWRADVVPAERTLDPLAPVLPVLTTIELRHVDMGKAFGAIRPHVVKGTTVIVGTLAENRLYVCGLQDEVGTLVAAVRAVDVETPR